jgi:hypothetical protein
VTVDVVAVDVAVVVLVKTCYYGVEIEPVFNKATIKIAWKN